MNVTCKYHPAVDAGWYCAHDGIHFCDDCVGGDDLTGLSARCLVCNKSLERLVPLVETMPFWLLLPHFLRYPFSPLSGLLIFVSALPLVLAGPWYQGAAMWAVMGLPLAAYGFAVLATTASGVLHLPQQDFIKARESWIGGLQVWFPFALAITGVIGAYHYSGIFVVLLMLLLGVLLVPSLWMGMLAYRGLGRSLAHFHVPMVVLGRDYFILTGALLSGALLIGALAWLCHDLFADWFAAVLSAVMAGWFWIFSCHLTGYIALQRQNDLELETPSRQVVVRRRRNRRPEEERRVQVLLREGRYDKVLGIFSTKLGKTPQVLTLNEQYLRLLQAMDRRDEIFAVADIYLDALLKGDNPQRILDFIRQLRGFQPGYKPEAPDIAYRVAETLGESGEYKLAVAMLQDLHQRAGDWHGVAEAYIYLARLLGEHLGLPQKAAQYLKFVEKQYQHPKVRQQVAACREQLGLA